MRRQTVYPGSIPEDTDFLNVNRNAMIALGRLCNALLGTGGLFYGLGVSPTSPASLSVNVANGELYQLQNVDNTAYGSLASDTTNTIVKQGILLASNAPISLSCPAPSTAGFSINYLIEATFAEVDGGNTVLPYYNAANPSQPYSGPSNTGASNSTYRDGAITIQSKAGVAATTGTQTTPALDSGYVALAVVTVANGQTTITAGNITAVTTNKLPTDLLHLVQQDAANYAIDTGTSNNYAIACVPAISALTDGMPLTFRVLNSNTGASTLSVNGLSSQSIVTTGHSALLGGELKAGSIATVVWNANASVFELQVGQAVGRLLNVQFFNSSGTYTPTPGTNKIIVRGIGGGGGGGGAASTSSSQAAVATGGGSGSFGEILFTGPISSQVVTIGAPGSGGLAGANAGTAGGNTVFGSLATFPGGNGGSGGAAATPPFLNTNAPAAPSAVTTTGSIISGQRGGIPGPGIALSTLSAIGGAGTNSPLGQGGNGNAGGAGNVATGLGAGGGGAGGGALLTACAGGAGSVGALIVFEYS